MDRSSFIARRGWMLVLGSLLAATPARSQTSQGVIDCSQGGHGAGCQVQLQPGQGAVTIHFRPSPPILGIPAPVFQVQQLPGGALKAAAPDPANPGSFTYTWSGSAGSDTTRLLVQSSVAGEILSDTVHLLPPRGPMMRVEIPRYYPYVWLRDTWLPLTIRAQVRAGQGTPQLTTDACERIRFAFQPRAGGKAEPDTGFARWDGDRNGAGICVAETRWRLGDATGDQQMRVVVGDGERVARADQVLTAYGREGPRVVAGIAYFTRHNSKRDQFCAGPETPEAECKGLRFGADTVKREFPVRQEHVAETFFGVEMPIFYSNQPGNGLSTWISRRLRVVVGSTFDEPADNVFLGATLIPLRMPAYERIPVQVHAGWRPSEGGFFFGGSVDGTALISNALKALGAPF